jgi:hypothetical protein
MRLTVIRVFVGLLTAVTAQSVDAQAVRGVVVDAADAPVAGAVVLLLDARSTVIARALTNESGEFRVSATQPGTYRLRTLRIGYKPAMSAPFDLAPGSNLSRRVAMDDIPVSLEAVTVTSRNVCSVRTDTAAATFEIWEQVRGALTAANVTGGSASYTARSIVYNRSLEAGRRARVLSQVARANEGRTTQPFRSIPADSLTKVGYVTTDVTGLSTFNAPGIEALLSDNFIDDHCLRVSRDSDAERVAIAFEPTHERSTMPEIKGTIWVDRKTSELRRLEFSYVNLTRAQRVGEPGGSIDFIRLRDGAWMISRWHIRLPVVEMRQQFSGVAGAITGGAEREQYFVREVSVQGGELAFVRRRNGDTLWSRPPMLLAGTLRDSVSGAAIAGAVIALRGSDLADTTDAGGQFAFHDVLPGEYLVDVRTASLSSAGLTHTIPFVFVDSSTRMNVRLPTIEEAFSAVCGNAPPSTGVVTGLVRLADDTTLVRESRVVMEWDQFLLMGAGVVQQKRISNGRTDANGVYRFCYVPVNTPLRIRVDSDKGWADPVAARLPDGARFLTADIVLNPGKRPDR